MTEPCRCGWDGEGEHPCHYGAYTCRKPATARFIPKPLGTYSLAGAQMKLAGYMTFACDEHWDQTTKEQEDGRPS